eukprot:4475547-Pyramimonas_sp.AAC.1
MHATSATVESAAAVSDKRISDHAAVVVSFSTRAPKPAAERPVPRELCREPFFLERLAGLIRSSDWSSMSLPFRLEHY